LFGVFFLADCSQYLVSNFYKPLGYGLWVIKVFFISFYGVGLGLMFILSFILKLKITSAWIGYFVACIV
jgi:Na+-driven multidrug efflux pump